MASHSSNQQRLAEIALLFLKLGFTAFGGPAAHIGLYYDEVVTRRKWLNEAEFLDLLGAVNLIPGPNSTEMAIHIGLVRGGWAGLILAGSAFILPAMLIVLGMAWAYVRFGSAPELGWLLYGVKPVVVILILQALILLARKAVRTPLAAGAVLLAVLFSRLGLNPLAVLLVGGLLTTAARLRDLKQETSLPGFGLLGGLGLFLTGAAPFSLSLLFLTFLKIGAVLYGSGYVLLAFLQADFVDRLGWLTTAQLLDAVAIGQVTPGPVFSSATFIGYLLGGLPGALLSTLAIFLPSFLFVGLINRFLTRLRTSPWIRSVLDGVNLASLGLMAAVSWELFQSSFIDPLTFLIGLGSALLLLRYRINSTWLILGGAAIGFLRHWLY